MAIKICLEYYFSVRVMECETKRVVSEMVGKAFLT